MLTKIRLPSYCLLAYLFTFDCYADSASDHPKPASCETPLFYESSCPLEVDLSLALDDFRSLPEGSWNGNWGGYTAVNFKAFLPKNFSTQLAGSFGLYDWAGRAYAPFTNPSSLQQQGFITVAASRQVACSGINAGIAYDWSLNKNFGVFAVNPRFDQIRGQLGYLIPGGNEIGVWATYGIRTSHRESQELPLKFRGISQVYLFWCHYFKSNGYGMIWAGTPYRRGLMYESGRPGNFTVGAQFSVPVTKHLSIEGHGAYMGPRGSSGLIPAKNYASNISFALTYSFGKRRTQQSPYMTLANNSNFLVDTNQNL
ncbi:MAG: hypothetical protein HYX48_00940 [Chlamydiales bacterium]|nr:hypothetical protein [Chlamydiales bacterium]